MKRIFVLFMVLAIPGGAHVGSPDAFFEGDAGPYHVFVTIRKPIVVPGIATFELRSRTGEVRQADVALGFADGFDSRLLPVPDLAQQSKADPQFFSCGIWLMTGGPFVAVIHLDGLRGKAEVSVPFTSYPQGTRPLGKPLGIGLLALMLLLGAGIISIASAFAREGDLEPGQIASPFRVRRGRLWAAGVTIFLVVFLWAGNQWWNAEAASHEAAVAFFQPPKLEASMEGAHGLLLRMTGTGAEWHRYAKWAHYVPDHGHLVHLFLLRVPGLDRMWHLHPEVLPDGAFFVELPPLDSGRYHLFADLVDQNGFPWTATGEIDLPTLSKPGASRNQDDSAWAGATLASAAQATLNLSSLPGGARMVLVSAASRAGVAAQFRFRVENADGSPVEDLEPYMGMAGHAEFIRSDLGVFAHIHPAGTAPMAAFAVVRARSAKEPMSAMPGMLDDPLVSANLSFPYGLPSVGRYRIFVQVKRSGQVQTGVFDITAK